MLHRLTEAFNRGDFAEATEIAHPEVEFVRSWEKSYLRGPGALRGWMEPDAFEDQHIEIREITVVGARVLVKQRLRARGSGSGIDVDVESWAVWTIDEAGLVTRLELYLHHQEADAREAAGLPT